MSMLPATICHTCRSALKLLYSNQHAAAALKQFLYALQKHIGGKHNCKGRKHRGKANNNTSHSMTHCRYVSKCSGGSLSGVST